MRKIRIDEKLQQIETPVETLSLGDFDQIGEFTAKKNRVPNSKLYDEVGCYFRPNYERGLLLHSLVKKFEVQSYLEIGFGRGYSTFCVAKAMEDKGIEGKIITIDPAFSEQHLKNLSQIFPSTWFDKIQFLNGRSEDVLPVIEGDFDLIYIDGDHTYDVVKKDWEMTKDRFNKFLLFDDYHLPTKDSGPGIQVAKLIDSIDDDSKELIIMDRRIFLDDRGYSDEEIDYGQVLLTNKDFDTSQYMCDW